MSETFAKLFGSITDSTIWDEDSDTRIVWVTMLAMADRHGYVGASIPGLAARARVPLEKTKSALDKFLGPDLYSRSKEFDGRRIEVADRGWNILNYDRFRNMRDEEVRKEYERERKRSQRAAARAAAVSPSVPDTSGQCPVVPPVLPASAQAEAEADPERETDPDLQPPPSGGGTGGGEDPSAGGSMTKSSQTAWPAGRWLDLFKLAWRVRYQRHYGMRTDGIACGDLSDLLAAMPPVERLGAQARSAEMFAAFLANDAPAVAKAKHPFAFFVTDFGGLCVPDTPGAAGSGGRKPRDIRVGSTRAEDYTHPGGGEVKNF